MHTPGRILPRNQFRFRGFVLARRIVTVVKDARAGGFEAGSIGGVAGDIEAVVAVFYAAGSEAGDLPLHWTVEGGGKGEPKD